MAGIAKLSSSGSNVHFHLSDLNNNEIIKHKAPSGDLIELSSLDDCTNKIKKTTAKYSLHWRQRSSGKSWAIIAHYVSSAIFTIFYNLSNNPLRHKVTVTEHLALTASVLSSVYTVALECPQLPFAVGLMNSILQIWKIT